MALFESYERRVDKINAVLAEYGINSIEECRAICKEKGFDPYEIVKGVQPIAFENAGWAYCVGAAIAIRKGVKTAAEAAKAIGIGLQSFCIPGSVADDRKVGLGHGNLGAMLLSATRTRPARSPCASSSTVLARTPPRSSAASTASPMSRPSLIITPAS